MLVRLLFRAWLFLVPWIRVGGFEWGWEMGELERRRAIAARTHRQLVNQHKEGAEWETGQGT